MPLAQGTKIGAYDVTGPLGAGGMGEVYRARDTKLDRHVALKVLPEAFTADPDRLARFEREAKVLASLNHPNIAQIYGVEESRGSRALVLELVEGPTLADRLDRGPIPLDEVLSIARQIALALQSAHESGVIHRDLKPANVKVRADGAVKVLDFGLAKALDTAPPAPEADSGMTATLTASVTRMGAGLVMGTPAYMSPEQAEGRPTDARGDLWSFGVVLYEMLAGERLFAGETVAQVLARVIDRDLDLSVLPSATPAPVRRLLRRCLERDRRRRMRDAGEAVSDLEAAASLETRPEDAARSAAAEPSPLRASRARLAWAAGGLALGALLAAAAASTLAPAHEPPAVRRLTLDLSAPMARGSALALSPDGSTLAYVARTGRAGRTRHLMARRLDEAGAERLDGTEGALDPFFSPDGAWIGFFALEGPPGPTERLQYRWTLKKTPVGGGAPVTLAENVPVLRGSWGDDDRIVIGALGGLLGVPAAGGAPEPLLPAGAVPELAVCSSPHVLPGSAAVLYAEQSPDGAQVKAVSLTGGEPRTVASDATAAAYTPTGHLLLQQVNPPTPGRPGPGSATLLAAPFDAERLELSGAPVPVVPGAGAAAWSADGTLLYAADAGLDAGETRRTPVLIDRDGREEAVSAPPRAYGTPRFSPAGDRIALDVTENDGAADVYVHDLARDATNRLTFDGWNVSPVWSPDGRRVVFTSMHADGSVLSRKAADGTGQVEALTAPGPFETASAWTGGPGQPGALLLMRASGLADVDIHLLPLDGDGRSEPLIASDDMEGWPAVSPDGRWLAYHSNESGRPAVYVRPFPNVEDGKWQVSLRGGLMPVWSRDGRELFYVATGPEGLRMMAVEYGGETAFTASRAERLFTLPGPVDLGGVFRNWDVAPDGRRFVVLREAEGNASPADPRQGPTRLVYVANWFTELAERVPVP